MLHFTRYHCNLRELLQFTVTALLYTQSLGRSVGAQITVDEVLASCSGGPRGNEQLRSPLTFLMKF